MDASRRPFENRVPGWLNHLLLGSVCAVGALILVVGTISLLAQATADAVMPMPHYSVWRHVIAMAAVAGLTVAVASGLVRLGQQLLAGVVVVGSVAGPMTLVAAPARASLVVEPYLADTRMWWHLVVGMVLFGLLVSWTWWVNKCLNERSGRPSRSESSGLMRQVTQAALFAGFAVLSIQAYSMVPAQSNEPVMRAVVGWGLQAAGAFVVVAFARTAWTALWFLVATGATLGMIFFAYSRMGGWPEVAGWEYYSMQSPIITSVASSATMLFAPLVGAVAWSLRLALRSVRGQIVSTTAALG